MISGLSISVVITFCHLSCWDGLAKSAIGGLISVGQKTMARFEEDMRLTELCSDILGRKEGERACVCLRAYLCACVCVIDTANYSNWYTRSQNSQLTQTRRAWALRQLLLMHRPNRCGSVALQWCNWLLSVFTDCAVGRGLQVKHPLPLPTQSGWFAQNLLFRHRLYCEPMSNCSTTCHTYKNANPSINGSDSLVQVLAQVRQYLQVHFWHSKQNLHKYFFTLIVVLRIWTSREKGGGRRERKGGYRNIQPYAQTHAHNHTEVQRQKYMYVCMYVSVCVHALTCICTKYRQHSLCAVVREERTWQEFEECLQRTGNGGDIVVQTGNIKVRVCRNASSFTQCKYVCMYVRTHTTFLWILPHLELYQTIWLVMHVLYWLAKFYFYVSRHKHN